MLNVKNYVENIYKVARYDGPISYGPDDSNFKRVYGNYMKAIAKANGYELLGIKSHPYCEYTCFFKKGNKYIYVASGDFRKVSYGYEFDILFRVAENEKDFRGGRNQYCKIEDIESNLIRCFED